MYFEISQIVVLAWGYRGRKGEQLPTVSVHCYDNKPLALLRRKGSIYHNMVPSNNSATLNSVANWLDFQRW